MSFVTTTAALMQATLQRSNASFGLQQNNQKIMGLANGDAMRVASLGDAAYAPGPNGQPSPIEALYLKERSLRLKNIQNQVQMAAARAMEESYQKMLEKSIKSEFSTFA